MQYQISYTDPSSRFIQLTLEINHIHQDLVHIQLPSWRPGRYELQNFARNVRSFSVKNKKGAGIPFKKVSKDRWEIETKGIDHILVSYEYYANQLDAGASYLCEEFLYINPVNCMMYMDGRMDEEYKLTFNLPAGYEIASQMKPAGKNELTAHTFDFLADSPLIASDKLEHHEMTMNSGDTKIHFWFMGKHPFDPERLKEDTRTYCEAQQKIFDKIPCSEYHFLYLMLDKPFRHGVEHLNSTVIAMGQLEDNLDDEFYNDLLAISSHEFFHLWNVKRIRPSDMLPYDFTKENYSTLGYVYEGVTTYYGDLMLLRSGVWNWEQYIVSLSSDLKKHFDNAGRSNYSVAESSWDTWLDGYNPGVPGRKVSIYIEGLIAALIADIMLLKESDGRFRLDDVMHEMYQNSKQGSGYTEEIYKGFLEKYAGISFDEYFRNIIWGKGYQEEGLLKAFETMGCELDKETLLLKVTDKENKVFASWSEKKERE